MSYTTYKVKVFESFADVQEWLNDAADFDVLSVVPFHADGNGELKVMVFYRYESSAIGHTG